MANIWRGCCWRQTNRKRQTEVDFPQKLPWHSTLNEGRRAFSRFSWWGKGEANSNLWLNGCATEQMWFCLQGENIVFIILYFHSSSEKKWKFHGAWPEAERGKEQKLQGMGFISFQSRVSSLFIALWMVKWPEQTKDLQFRDYSFPRGGMLMKWTTVLSMKWIAWGPLPMQWSTQKRREKYHHLSWFYCQHSYLIISWTGCYYFNGVLCGISNNELCQQPSSSAAGH